MQTKQGFPPRNTKTLCYTTQKFEGLKPRTLEIPHDLFLINIGNFALSLNNPRKSTCYFFKTPANSVSSTLLVFYPGKARFVFYCKFPKITLDFISELISLKYAFNVSFKITLKTIIMGTSSQFRDGVPTVKHFTYTYLRKLVELYIKVSIIV